MADLKVKPKVAVKVAAPKTSEILANIKATPKEVKEEAPKEAPSEDKAEAESVRSKNRLIAQILTQIVPGLGAAALGGVEAGAIASEQGREFSRESDAFFQAEEDAAAKNQADKLAALQAQNKAQLEEDRFAQKFEQQKQLLGQKQSGALALEKVKQTNKLLAANAKAAKPAAAKSTQFQAASFGRRVEQADQVFEGLEKGGFTGAEASGILASRLPNIAKSSERQQLEQAQRNFVNAILRRESGAAIAESEFESAEEQYFPTPGDNPAVLAQKKQNRALAQRALQAEAGPAWGQVTPGVSAAAQVAEQTAPGGANQVSELLSAQSAQAGGAPPISPAQAKGLSRAQKIQMLKQRGF